MTEFDAITSQVIVEGVRVAEFGEVLRAYREQKGISQVYLANEAGVSGRHLSFLETGRSMPSRDMVLQLGAALELEIRDTNHLLQKAGYSVEFSEAIFHEDKESLADTAVKRLLDHQNPFPAVAYRKSWDVFRLNNAGKNLLSLFPQPRHEPFNLLVFLFDPEGARPYIENFERISRMILRRMYREKSEEQARVLETVLDFPGAPKDFLDKSFGGEDSPILPVVLRIGDLRLSFQTVLTSFGSPQDISLEEMRIETFLPMDDSTESWCRSQPLLGN